MSFEEIRSYVQDHAKEELAVGAAVGLTAASIWFLKGKGLAADCELGLDAEKTTDVGAGLSDGLMNDADPFSRWYQTGSRSRWEPAKQLAAELKSSFPSRPYLCKSSKQYGEIGTNLEGGLEHIAFGKIDTPDAQADLLLAASYARLIKSDPLAKAAAARSARVDILGRQTEQHIIDSAVLGSKSYVDSSKGIVERFTGDDFSEYLGQRFGNLDQETLSQGREVVRKLFGP